jgi:uncharacterized membrane protein YraQ (UPF0718 family)
MDGLRGSRVVLRWALFGLLLAAAIRVLMPMESYATWFGASVAGLWLTLLAATVIEVCSEGATPIAADLMNAGQAPGNSFTFLMAGVATDYTEIMSIRDTTRSWAIALCLPLVTVPQVMLLGFLLNQFLIGFGPAIAGAAPGLECALFSTGKNACWKSICWSAESQRYPGTHRRA